MTETNPNLKTQKISNADQIYALNKTEDYIEECLVDLAKFYELFPDAHGFNNNSVESIVTSCINDEGVCRMITLAILNNKINTFRGLINYLADFLVSGNPLWLEILHQAALRLSRLADGSALLDY